MIVQCSFCSTRLRLIIPQGDLNQPAFTCPKCGQLNRVPSQLAPNAIPTQQTQKQAAAWLVQISEQENPATFELYEGLNTVGRLSASGSVNIAIGTTDKGISRHHFDLMVVKNSRQEFEFLIGDNGSANGTYINENKEKLQPHSQIYLADGDVILIGNTRLKLKSSQSKPIETSKTEINTDRSKTVLL